MSVGLFVPPDLHWIEGHFHGRPILAAVVQVREALLLARESWPDLAGLSRIRRAKFRRPILPGESIGLELRRRTDPSLVTFEYTKADQVCSSGSVEFG